jgi:trehalose 6-phosphate synthase/phosphatase
MKKRKLILVANRLPIRFEETPDLVMHESEGGLATGLASLSSQYDKQWIGWPGIHAEDETQRAKIIAKMDSVYHPVFLDQKEIDLYYKGFSNETIWPLFHYFMKYTQYKNEYWDAYLEVNKKFCDEVVKVAEEGDIIWVHDYHLMLLPNMLRERLNNKNPIGFFLHIPFVSYELFRTLPWRKQLLQGLLGADLVGFHTFEYMRHFVDTTYRVLGTESRLGAINMDGRLSYADTFPMGINFNKFNKASASEEVIGQLNFFKEKFGNVKLVLSVDRLDYTKGIIHRLKAFDTLLTNHPELKGTISLIMLTVPSRDNVTEYKHLKEEVDEMVGNINGKYSSLTWTAVHYLYRSVSFEQLVALYNLADIGLVTPLRDGMNLVAKEYVASKNHGSGVLILSEMAGSAIELEGALRINPNDQNAMANALYTALHMNTVEQEQRLKKMQQQVRIHSVEKWGKDFTDELTAIYEQARKNEKVIINGKETAEICAAFTEAEDRLIILDYDGTLAPFNNNPYDSKPSPELKTLLGELSKHATVVLLSGRDHFTMEEWFSDYGVELIAEHGVWHKEEGKWKQVRDLSNAWKSELYTVLESFVEKTPGASIEEKPFSLVFHYRRSDSWLAEIRVPQLLNALIPVCGQYELDIVDGNKVIEIRIPGIDKGNAAQKWLSHQKWDFIMAIGDDKTDEDMFAVMPDQAYTIKVGAQASKAKMRIKGCDKVIELLQNIYNFTSRKNEMKVAYRRNNSGVA